MPNHVAVGEIQTDKVVLTAQKGCRKLLSDFRSAHLRLQVVGGDFGRGDENAVFVGKGFFAAAVQEERHVGIFLGLGDAQLPQALLRNELADGVGHVVLVSDAKLLEPKA